jgi:hypothetical protein
MTNELVPQMRSKLSQSPRRLQALPAPRIRTRVQNRQRAQTGPVIIANDRDILANSSNTMGVRSVTLT